METGLDTLTTLATFRNEWEAQLLVNHLHEHGIAAVTTGNLTSQFRAEAPGSVQVVVKQESLDLARSVLPNRLSQN